MHALYQRCSGLKHVGIQAAVGVGEEQRLGAMICLAKHIQLPFPWLIGAQDQVQSELESFG